MSILVISFIPSRAELYAGVPLYLTITTNNPTTVYYTLDGTTPTTSSPIYLNPIEMPTEDVVSVSALAIDGSGNTATFTQIFGPFYYNLVPGGDGLIVNSIDVAPENKFIYGYNVEDIAVVLTDIPIDDYFINKSSVGYNGEGVGNANTILPSNEEQEPELIVGKFVETSTPLNARLFDPYAKNIVIDGAANNEVFILNRPYGSFRNDATYNYGKDYRIHGLSGNYISGTFTRHFYNANSNKLVSYYNDTNSLRTIKSIQPYVKKERPPGKQRFTYPYKVFVWIERGLDQSPNV